MIVKEREKKKTTEIQVHIHVCTRILYNHINILLKILQVRQRKESENLEVMSLNCYLNIYILS